MRYSMLKRDFRLFIRSLIPAAALTVVFSIVCAAAALSAIKGTEDVFTPVKTAVVDGEDSLMSRMIINAVAGMDYISELMDVSLYDMDEAMDGLRDGELAAVIILPEGTMSGIMSGKDTKGTIYLSSSAAAHADVVSGAAAFGELMLTAGQYGIFSAEHLIWRNGMEEQFHQDFLKKYNALLMAEAIGADSEYFDMQVTDYADTAMSTTAYYAVCWLTLLMLLVTMFFSRLYTDDAAKPMLCRLRGLGVGDGELLAGKVLFPFTFLLALLAAALWAVSKLTAVNVTAVAVLCAAAAALLAAVIGGGTIMAFRGGVPAVAAASVAGLLLCGGVIPRQLLPDAVLKLGSVTPFGAVQGLLMPIFGGRPGFAPVLAAAVYAVLLPLLVHRRLTLIRIGGDAE